MVLSVNSDSARRAQDAPILIFPRSQRFSGRGERLRAAISPVWLNICPPLDLPCSCYKFNGVAKFSGTALSQDIYYLFYVVNYMHIANEVDVIVKSGNTHRASLFCKA